MTTAEKIYQGFKFHYDRLRVTGVGAAFSRDCLTQAAGKIAAKSRSHEQ